MATRTAHDDHREFAIALSIGLFILACVTPALELRSIPEYSPANDYQPKVDSKFGIVFLLAGWVLLSLPVFSWLANVTLVFGWVAFLKRRFRGALLLAIASVLLAADVLRLIPGGTPPLGLLRMYYLFIERALPGIYLWLASMVVLGIGSVICWKRERPPDPFQPFAFGLFLLFVAALGWYAALRPLDTWAAQTNGYTLGQRVRATQPVGGTEADTLAFLRGLGIADEHIRLYRTVGRLHRIEAWFPRPAILASPDPAARVVVECWFETGNERLRDCMVYEATFGDPYASPAPAYTVTTPVPVR